MGLDVQKRARWLAAHILPYEPIVRARLRRMFVYGLELDDIIQEMYARVVSLPSLESIKYPCQYAIQTATAIIIDHVRRSRVISISTVGNLDQLEVYAPEASPEEQLEFREEIAEVAKALALLPERTREVLILRRIEGFSQKDTAKRLGISVKTVEKHMSQGVAALMTHFGRGGKTSLRPSTPMKIDDHDKVLSP
jgi:RNA polymerase sigma factor (sigma-70 family)